MAVYNIIAMTSSDSDKTLQTLYNEILILVEEEIYQRKQKKHSNDKSDDIEKEGQGGGTSNVNPMFCPGKFDTVRHSLNVPLVVALRGTAARQRLFISENQM